MTAEQLSRLVLLDPRDEHGRFEKQYAAPLFIRFTDKGLCVLHVLSNCYHARIFHLFLPNCENAIIQIGVPLFRNTFFYIYCVDKATVSRMQRTYTYLMYVKAFHADELSMYLHQAAIAHLVEEAGRQRTEENEHEHDLALQEAAHHARQLADELERHMIIATGRPPEED